MEETDLMEYFSRVRDGDKEAFTYICNELKQPVFTIACRIVQSKEIAEDVTQNVFLKLFVSPPDASINNPRAWIFQMTRNLAIDALRKKQSANLEEVELVAEDEMNAIAMRIDIESAIRKLPCDEREIVSLHLNGDLHFIEISRMIGLSVPATYRKYRKAIKVLRELLSGGSL